MTAQQKEALLKYAEIMNEADLIRYVDWGHFMGSNMDEYVIGLNSHDCHSGSDLIRIVEEKG